MVLELRPSHDPEATWGFVGVVVSTEDLSASVWRWHREGTEWKVDKVITIPAEPADPTDLPPALQPFGAVPPLVTDIDLSVDDNMLYVSCWGTGELKQYDVSDPATRARSVRSGSAGSSAGRAPAAPDQPLAGGPQMVEVSRDGRRVYVTNSLYGAWDDQFYPGRRRRLDGQDRHRPRPAGLSVDERFFPHGEDFRGLRRAPGPAAGRRRLLGLLLLPLSGGRSALPLGAAGQHQTATPAATTAPPPGSAGRASARRAR